MSSLRGRLTVWLLAGMGLLLAAGGLVLNRVISSRLGQDYDEELIAEARSLETLTEKQGKKVWLEFSDKMMPEFERQENPEYFQLWLRNGPALERSRSLGNRDLPRWKGPPNQPLLRDVTLPDGRRGRQVEISYQPWSEALEKAEESKVAGDGPMVTLAVAHTREDLDELLASVRLALTLVVVALLAGTALLVKAVVRVALGPLDSLADRLEGMDADSLGPLPAADAPAELAPVVQHLNGLLARLDASFLRERSFSAHLAHELRTPLAELRALTEVTLKWPGDANVGDADAGLEALREIQGIGLQMERVVVNLLALARCDGGQHTVWPSEVRLCEMAASCWETCAPEAEDKGMALQLEIPETLTVVTDAEKLALILANLVSNAVAHGRPGSRVTCSATTGAAGFALRVGNFTDVLTAEDLPRICDRFWSKGSGGGHAGLGLALVAALCELLAFTHEARLADGWFEIILRGSSSFLHPGGASLPAFEAS